MSQIRLTRTNEIDSVLSSLQERYPLLSEAEIIKMVLSEKYSEMIRNRNIIDLETASSVKDAQTLTRTPRKRSQLLSLAGVLKGAKDLSNNKKKYTY
jgi:hypothetical protein